MSDETEQDQTDQDRTDQDQTDQDQTDQEKAAEQRTKDEVDVFLRPEEGHIADADAELDKSVADVEKAAEFARDALDK